MTDDKRLEEAKAEQARLRAELARVSLVLHEVSIQADPTRPSPPIESSLSKALADNVRLARLEARLKQGDLAALSGISRSHISLIETDSAGNLTLGTVERLAKHLNRTALELLTPRQSRR